jgi:hypothetical protein
MIRFTCAYCGNTDVQWDATASWDESKQEYVLDDVSGNSWCCVCEGECSVDESPLPLLMKLTTILCTRCRTIIKYMHEYTEEETKHACGEIILPARLCDKCKNEIDENI